MSERYTIQGKIGQGGLGAVYKAFDTKLKREVALKRVLTPEEGSKEEVAQAAEKLTQEATALSSLMHPNIVTVFDVGADDSGGFVVMELLDGETLDETVSRGLLTLPDFSEVVNQTLEALIAAQSVNLIHRDLKPTNIMVIWRPSGKFQVKVLDFGLAKVSEQPSIQTIDHGDAILGSIYFMAPEQFERRKLDFRTDMYAMGCIYYYSLTGKYPFDGESAPQVMAAHLQHKVKPLKEMRPDLPDEVCQWVMWLINRDITRRPGNAREALERFPDPTSSGSGPVYVAAQAEEEEVATAILVAEEVPEVAAAAPRTTITTSSTGKKFKTGPAPTKKGKTGSISGRVSLKTGPVSSAGLTTGQQPSHAVAAAELAQIEAAKKRKLVLIIISAITATTMIAITLGIVMKNRAAAESARRTLELVNEIEPRGTIADVDLLVARLSPKIKDQRAAQILAQLQGSGVDQALLAHLKNAEPGSIRSDLVRICAARPIPDAFGEILKIFKEPSSPTERSRAAGALKMLAEPKDLGSLLPLLRLTSSLDPKDRKLLEDAIIVGIRADSNADDRVTPVLDQLDTSRDAERKSLIRILGSCGGKKALTKLETIFSDADQTYQYDAILAFNVWPDRSCQPLLAKLMTDSADPNIQNAAANYFTRILRLPSKNLDDGAAWKQAIEAAKRPQDQAEAIGLALQRPVPASIKFLNELTTDPPLSAPLANQLKLVAASIQETIKSAIPLKSGELLPATGANLRGGPTTATTGNGYDEEGGYVSNWNDPGIWFQWLVDVTEPGAYELVVLIANDGPPDSEIKLIAAGTEIKVNVPDTEAWDKFNEFKVGEFVFTTEHLGPHLIFLTAGEVVQKRIANVKGIKLTKKGG